MSSMINVTNAQLAFYDCQCRMYNAHVIISMMIVTNMPQCTTHQLCIIIAGLTIGQDTSTISHSKFSRGIPYLQMREPKYKFIHFMVSILLKGSVESCAWFTWDTKLHWNKSIRLSRISGFSEYITYSCTAYLIQSLMFVSWAETSSICKALSSRTFAVFSSRLLHPSLDLCMPSAKENITQNVHERAWYIPPIWTHDFGACFMSERRPHTLALLKIPSMSALAFDSRSSGGSFRSAGASFPSATGSSASNLVNNTTTGTDHIMSSRQPWWRSAYHFQGHILQRTSPLPGGLLVQAYPLGCSTCPVE